MEIVLRSSKGEKASNLADEYGVSRNLIYLLKKFLDGDMSKLSIDSDTEQKPQLEIWIVNLFYNNFFSNSLDNCIGIRK